MHLRKVDKIVVVFDFFGALAITLLSFPLWFWVGYQIWKEDGFPVLFKQNRLGVRGVQFKIFKFRSMRKDAEEMLRRDPELFKLYVANDYKLPAKKDPRLLKVGRQIRANSLDELPQLLNVLKGEMSLVGPRPIVPIEIEKYGTDADEFLSVKPGMTGLWQILGRSNIDYPERRFLELTYIRNFSISLYFEILFRTVFAVLRKKGAH
jgi:lipopolysaccharide/colanic/teichoic acid biosynthesis glycosyltransferase